MQVSSRSLRNVLVCVVLTFAALTSVAQQQNLPSSSGSSTNNATAQQKEKALSNSANSNSTALPPGNGAVPPLTSTTSTDAVGYIIGEQDVLAINVWRETELSTTVTVRPDGIITLPLVNDVYVIGMSTDQLKTLLTEKLKPYVNIPQVTVTVREVHSRKVYVVGQGAAHEGPIRINSTMTVLQLIAEAGGLRDFAKRKKIYVMRAENGRPKKYAFNYDEVIRGIRPQQNILVQPGDTVVVP